MKNTTINVLVEPFPVPTTIVTTAGIADRAVYPLSVLSADVLDEMCREFRLAVFKNAKKELPPEPER